MSTPVMPPTDNAPAGCTDVEFAVWAARFRKRRADELVRDGVRADRIREMVDLEVDAARRRSRLIQKGTDNDEHGR